MIYGGGQDFGEERSQDLELRGSDDLWKWSRFWRGEGAKFYFSLTKFKLCPNIFTILYFLLQLWPRPHEP